jgi:flagellar secretion chaperone FliS
MSTDARQAYLETRILTASPIEIVRLLYSSAIEAVESARQCVSNGDIRGRTRAINHALDILNELTSSLDPGRGGILALSLAELYDYMRRRLMDAQIQQAEPPLAEVAKLLNTILSAWREVQTPLEPSAPEPAPAYVETAAVLPPSYAASTTGRSLDQLF